MSSRQYKNIAVLRALQLGDLLCSIPAFRALRATYPQANITLIGLPWAKEFVKRFPKYFDKFIVFPGFPGLPEQDYQTELILKFIKNMNNKKFDLLIQMHGDGSIINPVLQLLGAKKISGFYRRDSYCPNAKTFLVYPKKNSEVKKTLMLLQHLHVSSKDDYLEFPIFNVEKNKIHKNLLFKNLIKNSNYVCIHPGARDRQRRWDPYHFAYIADKLVENNFSVVLTGVKEEILIIKKVAKYMKYEPIIFAGQTSLDETAEILKHASLLISNCTGIVHIADALHIPSITMYLASDPDRWGPRDTTLHKRIVGRENSLPATVYKEAVVLLKHQLDVINKERVLR